MRPSLFVTFIGAIAALAGLLFGFDTGVISGALLFIQQEFQLTDVEKGAVVSAVLFGAFIGSLFCGKMTDAIGRKNTLLITGVLFVIASIAAALSTTVWYLILCRFLLGISIGISSFAAPLYISETAPAKHRGKLVALFQLAITVGILFAYLIDLAFVQSGSWRWMVGFGVFPAILFFITICFVPKSPRWLLFKKRPEQALAVLKKIRSHHAAEREFELIKESLSFHKASWRDLFKKWLLPVNIIGLGLAFFQQITGINTIIYYAPTILKSAGFANTASVLATAGVGIINVLFTILALPLLDKIGRRPLLLAGITGMGLGQFALSYVFSHPIDTPFLQSLAVGGMFLFIACFAFSFGIIMWLMFSEIFPLEIRGLAMSLSVAMQWFFNMVISFSFLPLIARFGESGIFLIFGCVCVCGWIFTYFIIPETKHVSLEEIETHLKKGERCINLGQKIR